MPALYTKINCRTVAGSLTVSPLTIEWSDRMTILGLDTTTMLSGDGTTITESLLFQAYQDIDEVPAVADMHPIYEQTCCSGLDVRPAPGNGGDSPDGVIVDVRWLMARRDRDGNKKRALSLDQYQLQEIRNFDINGDKTKVLYKVDHPDPLFPPYRIADIRCPRTMHALKITQYEDLSGEEIGKFASLGPNDQRLPVYNDKVWLGFGANTLLYLGRRIFNEGLPICRVEYSFLTNDRGWNKFIAVYTQQNGYVPKDLDDLPPGALQPLTDASDITQNGIGVFDMLAHTDFDDFFPQIPDIEM